MDLCCTATFKSRIQFLRYVWRELSVVIDKTFTILDNHPSPQTVTSLQDTDSFCLLVGIMGI